jgi:hypothetical protein
VIAKTRQEKVFGEGEYVNNGGNRKEITNNKRKHVIFILLFVK